MERQKEKAVIAIKAHHGCARGARCVAVARRFLDDFKLSNGHERRLSTVKVIAFCGIDGSGKTTQISRVREVLINLGYKVFVSKVEYYPFHLYQNNIITQYEIRLSMAFAFAKHYLSLLPRLERQGYNYVLCDRHALCHLAFAKTYGLSQYRLARLETVYALGGHPALTLLFDLQLNEAIRRIHARTDKLVADDETPGILRPTLRHYHELIQTRRFRDAFLLNATLPAEKQTRIIVKMIQELGTP